MDTTEQQHPERDEAERQLSEYRRTRHDILCIRAKMGYRDAIEALRVEYGEFVELPEDPRQVSPVANVRTGPI